MLNCRTYGGDRPPPTVFTTDGFTGKNVCKSRFD